MKSIILTAKSEFSWASIDEIQPLILDSWKKIESSIHHVKVIDIDKNSLHSILKEAIDADNIILLCISSKLLQIAHILRHRVGLEVRFIFHTFHQASIGCWPLRYFCGDKFFIKSDVFVTSCRRDQKCLQLTFPKGRIVVVPFPPDPIWQKVTFKKGFQEVPFIYVGRLSSQKQIHQLLFSFFIFKKKYPGLRWKLKIIGKPDDLGSPNMGIREAKYGAELKKLTKRFDLNDQVEFFGFLDRQEIRKLLSHSKHIFTSLSLHSDENFGVAAYQALVTGHTAVLSDWGGHFDLKLLFPKQVFLCSVNETKIGPNLKANEVCIQLKTAFDKYSLKTSPKGSIALSKSIFRLKRGILDIDTRNHTILNPSKLSNVILRRARHKLKKTAKPKTLISIFNGYQDPLAQRIFKSYGMGKALQSKKSRIFVLHPWVQIDQKNICINDYHRGYRAWTKNLVDGRAFEIVQTFDEKEIRLCKSDFNQLYQYGYIEDLI